MTEKRAKSDDSSIRRSVHVAVVRGFGREIPLRLVLESNGSKRSNGSGQKLLRLPVSDLQVLRSKIYALLLSYARCTW